ncbi:ABC transporter permease [Acidisphaera sp. L21]|uniref:ABC transporter permease n=1 Tax=Acidisphaera sp. L21 TaxID=1641851 RepID=UPI00131B0599|nr:ABC transporter permease [Acidisphaera sp. L21]
MLKASDEILAVPPTVIPVEPSRAIDWIPAQRVVLLVALLLLWWGLVRLGVLDPFFFGDPVRVAVVVWNWCTSGTILVHLGYTLSETLLAFALGTVLGIGAGLVLGLKPKAARLFDPFIKAANATPRVVLAPIFALWFGLGIWSKVALGTTLVFFVVFFNVFQGVREVSPIVLDNIRMLGASRRDLLRYVYFPSATSWVFSSLHNAIGMAFVGAVIGEYLGSVKGVGFLILQAEGSFNVDAVFAGIVILTICALVLDLGVSWIERRLLVWRPTHGQADREAT